MNEKSPPRTKVPRAKGPQVPADYNLADAVAFQALARGDADEFQQKRVLEWVVHQAAGTYEFQYYPTDRDTAFSLGRAFVGQQIVKLLKIDPTILRRKE